MSKKEKHKELIQKNSPSNLRKLMHVFIQNIQANTMRMLLKNTVKLAMYKMMYM
jgi:leucyl-tRNA synthetase